MCGIGGFIGADLPPDPAALTRMCELLAHRGPDDRGIFVDGPIGLAHTRLSLLDLSPAGHQPWVDGEHALVFNGEIYNFREERAVLEASGATFDSGSDTEVLFRSLVDRGVDQTLSRLRGMFAFAFVDLRSHRTVLCRDRFGIKPLVYRSGVGHVAFASEAKALAAVEPLEIDPVVALFSITGMADHSKSRTPFRGVEQVEPGSYVVIEDGRVSKRVTYYALADQIDESRYRCLEEASWNEVVDELDELLERSVRSVAFADAPVGAFVSGGVDSGLIASYGAASSPSDFTLFTADVVGAHSEREGAEALSRHIRRPLVSTPFEPGDLLGHWARCTWGYETPLVKHTNAMPFSALAERTRDAGFKAVLTGEGADELFLGYPTLLFDRYRPLVEAPLRLLDRLYGLSPRLAHIVLEPRSDPAATFLRGLSERYEHDRIERSDRPALDFLPRRDRALAYNTLDMFQEHLLSLLHRNDRMGMLSGIESRFPFLDEDLVSFGLNLPVKWKAAHTSRVHNLKHPFLIDKAVVRRLAARRLPPALAERPKEGFPMYGLRNVRLRDGAFRDGYVADLLSLDDPAQSYLIDQGATYQVAKLFSVEVFGRLFGLGHSIDEVTDWVTHHATVVV
jgi:asparagine synthase (glutamine-hydrolysing)